MADEPTGSHMTAHDRAHDEPTAIRHPKRGKVHRPVEWKQSKWLPPTMPKAACNHLTATYYWERVPLSQTDPAIRCRNCWPTTKETR